MPYFERLRCRSWGSVPTVYLPGKFTLHLSWFLFNIYCSYSYIKCVVFRFWPSFTEQDLYISRLFVNGLVRLDHSQRLPNTRLWDEAHHLNCSLHGINMSAIVQAERRGREWGSRWEWSNLTRPFTSWSLFMYIVKCALMAEAEYGLCSRKDRMAY